MAQPARGPRRFELVPEQLRWRCPCLVEARFEDLPPARTTIGQDRAVDALRLGLEIRSPGYNIYVAGLQGTGRTTTVRELTESLAPARCPVLRDLAYVFNFKDPDHPLLLEFRVGEAPQFRDEMDQFIARLVRDIPKLLEDDTLKRERATLEQTYRNRIGTLGSDFDEKLEKEGFAVTKLKLDGVAIAELSPIIDGKTVPIDAVPELEAHGKIAHEAALDLLERYEALRREFDDVRQKLAEAHRELGEKLAELERKAVTTFLHVLLGDLGARFPVAKDHLTAVPEAVIRDLDAFRAAGEPGPEKSAITGLLMHFASGGPEDVLQKYRVNVLQDNSGRKGCPVVFEDVPTQANLIGSIEVQVMKSGVARTSFLHVKGGSLLRADGGFLILNVRDVLFAPGAWQALKRVLKSGRLAIAIPESPLLPGVLTLKPQPVTVDVKVILIGEPWLYEILRIYDEDFSSIFKIKADFDHEMKVTPETLRHFLSVVSRICREEKLLPLEADAMGAIVEESVRRTGRQGHVTARFSDVADLVRESTYWARHGGAERITAAHVRKAIREQNARHQRIEEKIQEMIDRGTLAIEVSGSRVGQINGLSVFDLGTYRFGRPSRITATAAIGRAGVLSVEREAGLSGAIHDKGVLTLAGLLRGRYAQDFPLSLSASIAFEQSYGGVEGDSASSTEVYALLSALADAPIRQSIAVTGSVDQHGRVQAIGGANEKIEGFYTVCKAKGLTGDQGVMIPATNVGDLMLEEEVVRAVADGKFHVWAVATVDEGIEILTGLPAGARDADGAYPPESINGRAQARLREYAERLARFEHASPA